MGQAKRRGTFEERRAQAVEREQRERAERAARRATEPLTKRGPLSLLAFMALAGDGRRR